MNRCYGMKIWSINNDWIDTIVKRYDEGFFRYIELFAVPDTYDNTAKEWETLKTCGIPVKIHGVHSGFNVNWADKNSEEYNKKMAKDSFRFADLFHSDIIIFHPGFEGTVEESIRQLHNLNDSRIVIENKPHISKSDKIIVFRGSTPEELKLLLDGTGYGCCVDFAHAICSANSHNVDGYEYVRQFLKLPYKICHLSDNTIHNTMDIHLGIGKGEYDFKKLLSYVRDGVYLTLETPKDSFDDYINDIQYLRNNT